MAIGLIALFCVPAFAQVDVQASLSRDTVQVGDTVELTVAVTGVLLGIDAPVIPQIDYLPVTSTASSTNIEVVGGDIQRTTVFSYQLSPRREGTYTIPPLSVPVGDDTYTTPALSLNVQAATTASPPGAPGGTPQQTAPPDLGVQAQPDESAEPLGDIAATTEVDDDTPWVGQQVTLTLKFLQKHTMHLVGNAEYEPPSTDGLVAEPLPDDAQQTQVVNGEAYEVATRKTSLIAPAPGEYTIGPATVTFRRSLMSGDEAITTEPITLKVRPLPTSGKPAGFSGAVGSLQLGMSLQTTEVQVGEAVPLRLEISGTGDLRQIEPPEVGVEGDARVYQSGEDRQISPQATPDGYKIGGRVSFDYLIMPRAPGQLRIKPIVVYYFNPGVARYQSAQTSPATITVSPGEAGETTPASTGDELRYIKETGLAVSSRPPVTAHPWFWALQLLPVLGLGWALRERSERLRRERDPRYRRRVEAAKNARRALNGIAATSSPSDVYYRVDEMLAEYIAARTGASAAMLSPESAYERLLAEGAPEAKATHARDLLRRIRAGAYAPGVSGAPAPAEAVNEAREVIDALEEALR